MPARAICDFCYRPATRELIAARRTLGQVIAKRNPRRTRVCHTGRCAEKAVDYLAGRKVSAR